MTSPNTIIADMQAEIDALRKDRDELMNALIKIAGTGVEFPSYFSSYIALKAIHSLINSAKC